MIEIWTCDICGQQREDRNIAVLSYPLKDLPNAERNIRFCNDDEKCRDGAIEKSKTGKL